MNYTLLIIYRIYKKLIKLITILNSNIYCRFIFWIFNVDIGKNFIVKGFPAFFIEKNSSFSIGNNVHINNGEAYNPIGRQNKCIFSIKKNAILIIGNNVGISSSTIVARSLISIGDNVKIGGNTVIYDTDFHSLLLNERIKINENYDLAASLPVIINDGVFIGAHTTVLKGVEIGKNSIIGACSVVTKNIPENQIWAGNPAKFIKNLSD